VTRPAPADQRLEVRRLPGGRLRGTAHLLDLKRDPLGFLGRIRSLGDLVTLQVGAQDVHFAVHPAAVEAVLVTNQAQLEKSNGREPSALSRILARGELVDRVLHFPADGNFWTRERAVVQPVFNRRRVETYADTMAGQAARAASDWRDGEVRDMDMEMARLNLQVVMKTLFVADGISDTDRVIGSSRVIMAEIARRMGNPFQIPPLVPTRRNRRLFAAVGELERFFESLLGGHRLEVGDADLFALLTTEPNGDASELHRRFQLMTLVLAGYETTALSLLWSWHLLATHPSEQERLHREVAALGGRDPTFDDLADLPHAAGVVKESLRLYPPVWVFGPRRALRECEIAGVPVRRGSLLVVSPWATQRHPGFFDDPDTFRPDRWRNGSATPFKYAYFPFSGGDRHCIGHTFAMTEAVLTLATIARRFRVEPVRREVVLEPTITLRPKDGLPLVVRAR
jgi:cytochrome P450